MDSETQKVIPDLQKQINDLRFRLDHQKTVGFDRFDGRVDISECSFNRRCKFADAVNIELSSTTGTEIGTAATQKLSLWGATPIVQPASDTNYSGHYAIGGSAVNDRDTFDGDGTNSTKYSISGIVKILKNVGILTP